MFSTGGRRGVQYQMRDSVGEQYEGVRRCDNTAIESINLTYKKYSVMTASKKKSIKGTQT